MHIGFRATLRCDPEIAWRAIHTPAIGARLGMPVMRMRVPQLPDDAWRDGDDVLIGLDLFGLFRVGTQTIAIRDQPAVGERRTMMDAGRPETGILGRLSLWEHTMSVEPGSRPGTTLWTDSLTFAGPGQTIALCALWPLWQWRRIRLRMTAPRWRIRPAAAPA